MARNDGKRDVRHLIRRDARSMTFVALLVLSLAIGGTLAYLSANSNVAANDFTAVAAPSPVILANGVAVGNSTSPLTFDTNREAADEIKIQNRGIEGFLRVRLSAPQQMKNGEYVAYDLSASELDANGFKRPDANNTVDFGAYQLVFDANWERNWDYVDGWFYYRKLLPAFGDASSVTEPLLSKVRAADDGYEVEVGVIAETLEKDADRANAAWGLDATTGCYVEDAWVDART